MNLLDFSLLIWYFFMFILEIEINTMFEKGGMKLSTTHTLITADPLTLPAGATDYLTIPAPPDGDRIPFLGF